VSVEVTLIGDPRVLAIPVEECGEPLVDLRDLAGLAIDERKRDADALWLQARIGIAKRLRDVQRACPSGLRLLLIEAYRPVELQRRYFAEYVAQLALQHPEWDSATLRANASRYVAPPEIDPPHSTGGAIDLTLMGEDRRGVSIWTRRTRWPSRSAAAVSPSTTWSTR
jgi:zinc D-Ala-D-Ala dipeptidase